MITQSLQAVVTEVADLWSWMIGIVAGWGLTFTLVVVALVYAHIRIARLQRKITHLENRQVTDARDLSLRIRKFEK
jgi:uncharacterized membrane protein YciS (DUF1049 family)